MYQVMTSHSVSTTKIEGFYIVALMTKQAEEEDRIAIKIALVPAHLTSSLFILRSK